jgi:hypothetical protein
MDKLIFWLPRVLGIIFVLFLMMFSLDVFEPGRSAGEIAVGLFMHNIPALILAAILAISWKKYPVLGGITFIFGGLFYIAMLARNPQFEWFMLSWSLLISGPAFLIGILFLIGLHKNKN